MAGGDSKKPRVHFQNLARDPPLSTIQYFLLVRSIPYVMYIHPRTGRIVLDYDRLGLVTIGGLTHLSYCLCMSHVTQVTSSVSRERSRSVRD